MRHIRLFSRSGATVEAAAPPSASQKDGGQFDQAQKKARNTRLASVVIAVTFQRLIDDAHREWTLEEELVLQALRRSNGALEHANAAEIGLYLRNLSPDQLRGVASNVKGIYHELLFVQTANSDWVGMEAKVKEFTNHPGGDVEFIVEGDVVREVQLKAVASATLVREHLARYPDIEVLATEEVAATMDDVGSSGFRNEDLMRDVNARLEELHGDGVIEEIGEGLLTSALVSSAVIARQAVRGQTLTGKNVRSFLTDAGVGATTAMLLETILLPVTS